MHFLEKINELLLRELSNIFVFIPVMFGIGIVIYFQIPFEPDFKNSIIGFLVLIIMLLIFRKNTALNISFMAISIIYAGFLTANYRTIRLSSIKLSHEIGVKKVYANIEKIKNKSNGKQVLFENVSIAYFDKKKTPKKIRVTFKTKLNGAKIGDRASFLAVLSPPPKAVIPNGYDFSKYAYFQQIGAVGYAVSDMEIIEEYTNFSFKNGVEKIRQKVIDSILSYGNNDETNIILALTVGEKGGIHKDTIEKIRKSGIAHLLAISGMHLTLVATIFFVISRFSLVLIPKLPLKYNIKKWSALVSIFGSLFYLALSGSTISAQRAFIMTTLFLSAIIIDRQVTPMRSVALAALIILIFTPESIITASFQMSFAAVIALIAFYESFQNTLIKLYDESIFKKFLYYLLSLISSSLVAGMATAPFAIYHFNSISGYGFLTNLIAIPFTSFVVMPLIVINIFMIFIDIEIISMPILIFTVEGLKEIAFFISELPETRHLFKNFSNISLGLFVIGAIILALLKTIFRLIGILIIIIALILSIKPVVIPDIMIGNQGKLIAIKDNNDEIYFSSRASERYIRTQWQKKFNIKNPKVFKEYKGNNIVCDKNKCDIKNKNLNITIIKSALPDDNCINTDFLINLTEQNYENCFNNKFKLEINDILSKGVHFIYFINNNIKIETVKENTYKRLWNI